MVSRSKGRIKWETVNTAPCKEVILKGEDVDLTRLPLFLHHDRDGHACTDDNLFISKHPGTGVCDWRIYRSMFRTKDVKSVDMTCTSHRQRIHAMAAAAKGQNLGVAIVLGGLTIDKISALVGVTTDTDDFEVLGAFHGAAAKMIKCETIDVMVPANAGIVLEYELMALEPAIEAGLFNGLKQGGTDVHEVCCPAGGLSNIAHAKMKPLGGGDFKQALGIMLTCSKQGLPKVAMVFGTDGDIWDDQAVPAAMAYRYMPHLHTVRLDGLNTMTVDPKSTTLGISSKIGMDCTVPLGSELNPDEFVRSTVVDLGDPPADLKIMTEEALTKDMEAFVAAAPRAWHDILKQYHGQPYPVLYCAFGNPRPKLGRTNDPPWCRYALSDKPFAWEAKPQALNHSDPRPMKTAG